MERSIVERTEASAFDSKQARSREQDLQRKLAELTVEQQV